MTVSSGTDCVFADGVRIVGCFPVKWDGQSPRFLPARLQGLRTLGLGRNYHSVVTRTRGGDIYGNDGHDPVCSTSTARMGTPSASRPRPARGRTGSPSDGPLRYGPLHLT